MKDLNEALKEAVKRGDTQGAKEIIRTRPYSFTKFSQTTGTFEQFIASVDKFSAFKLAAKYGNTEILKFVEYDSDITNYDSDDEEASVERSQLYTDSFVVAFENKHCETARYL